MAMGAEKGSEQASQIEMVCLDELVPADDLYRRLDALLDWGFVREAAAPFYAKNIGRPSIDPIVLLKLMLTGALEGSASMRELLRLAALRLDLRRFLGYGISERLPAHQTISDAHALRFAHSDLFERLFVRSVALCAEAGLVDGSHLSLDGFHAEANAALSSLRASLGALPAETPPAEESADDPSPPAQLSLAPPRSGRTPRRKSSNATAVSRSDPEARLRGKPGQRPHLVFRGQVAVDARARVIVAVRGERADGFEGDAVPELLDRARFCAPALESFAADKGYAAKPVWEEAADRSLVAYVPPRRSQLPPLGEAPTTAGQALALAARTRCKSAAGIWAHAHRLADAEGAIAELKCHRGMDRARRRGMAAFHTQLLIAAAANNLRRLARWRPQAQSGAAAQSGDETLALRISAATCDPGEMAGGALRYEALDPYITTVTLCLN
jgi:transposase